MSESMRKYEAWYDEIVASVDNLVADARQQVSPDDTWMALYRNRDEIGFGGFSAESWVQYFYLIALIEDGKAYIASTREEFVEWCEFHSLLRVAKLTPESSLDTRNRRK